MEEKQAGIRINKYLSEAGVCSRRAADREIEKGNVWIDGRKAVTGDRILPGMKVTFCGKEVSPEDEEILIAFHKPVGSCVRQRNGKKIISLIISVIRSGFIRWDDWIRILRV